MKVGGLGYQPDSKFGFTQPKPNELAESKGGKDVFTMSQSLTIASQISYQKMLGVLPFENKIEPTKPEDLFNFEEVAKNVLSFVKGAILNAQADGADNEKLTNMFDQARKGVEQGIGEAIEELQDSDLYTEEVEEGIEKSRDLIFGGIDELEESIFNPNKPESLSGLAGQDYYQLDNGASFEITTAEGDVIKLTYNSQFTQSQNYSYSNNEDGETFSYSASQSSSQALSFSVEGDLNDVEVAAINDLMADLQKVSDEFFNGSLDEAFEKAKELNLESPQLVAMSMNLQQSEVRASVREYQTAQPGTEIAKQFEPINEGLANSYEKAKPLNIENQLVQLLTWLNQKQEAKGSLIDYSNAFFDQLQKTRGKDN